MHTHDSSTHPSLHWFGGCGVRFRDEVESFKQGLFGGAASSSSGAASSSSSGGGGGGGGAASSPKAKTARKQPTALPTGPAASSAAGTGAAGGGFGSGVGSGCGGSGGGMTVTAALASASEELNSCPSLLSPPPSPPSSSSSFSCTTAIKRASSREVMQASVTPDELASLVAHPKAKKLLGYNNKINSTSAPPAPPPSGAVGAVAAHCSSSSSSSSSSSGEEKRGNDNEEDEEDGDGEDDVFPSSPGTGTHTLPGLLNGGGLGLLSSPNLSLGQGHLNRFKGGYMLRAERSRMGIVHWNKYVCVCMRES